MKATSKKGGKPMPPMAKRAARDVAPEGDAAPARADRPARKAPPKKGC